MEIPTRNKLLQEDQEHISFHESAALQKPLYGYYHRCFEQPPPQDFTSLVYSGGAISHPDRIMQVGFSSSSSSKRRRAAAADADIIQVHGGGRVVRAGGGRKDRHSKVCTARGTRDRRVRLSPKTAIQFYDVQDRLGYDRASKAIDWLMKEAKSSIDALQLHAPPPPLPNITDNYFVDDTNCFAEGHHDGVAVPFSSSYSSEFQVFPVVDETPEEYSIVDPRFQEAFSTWNYAREDDYDDDNSSVVRSQFSDREIMFSQREPLQSIYPMIPGITFSNQELLPDFPATNSFLHFQE